MLRIDILQGPHNLFYNALGSILGILRNTKKYLTWSYTLKTYNSLGEIKMYTQISSFQSGTKTCWEGFKRNKNAVRAIKRCCEKYLTYKSKRGKSDSSGTLKRP